jgi:hypothetical protein
MACLHIEKQIIFSLVSDARDTLDATSFSGCISCRDVSPGIKMIVEIAYAINCF